MLLKMPWVKAIPDSKKLEGNLTLESDTSARRDLLA